MQLLALTIYCVVALNVRRLAKAIGFETSEAWGALVAGFAAFPVGISLVPVVGMTASALLTGIALIFACVWGAKAEELAHKKLREEARLRATKTPPTLAKVNAILLARDLVTFLHENAGNTPTGQDVSDDELLTEFHELYGATLIRVRGELADNDLTDTHLDRQGSLRDILAAAYALERLASHLPEDENFPTGKPGPEGSTAVDRLEAHVDKALDSLKKGFGTIAAARASTPPPLLRSAAQQLLCDVRDWLKSLGSGRSREAEFDDIYYKFLEAFHPRLTEIKKRLRTVLGRQAVTSEFEWLPIDRENIGRLMVALEQEALRVPEDVLL